MERANAVGPPALAIASSRALVSAFMPSFNTNVLCNVNTYVRRSAVLITGVKTPSTFPARLALALEESGISQAKLADEVGYKNQSAIGNILADPQRTGSSKTFQMAQALGVNPEWLADGAGPMRPTKAGVPVAEYAVSSDTYVTVLKLSNELGLGHSELQEFDEVDGRFAFRRDWIAKNGYDVTKLRVVCARGDSQKPYIKDGDVVLINTAQKRIIDGEFYALRTEDGATIKQCFRQLDGKVRLEALNAPTDYLTPDHVADIIGQVVHRAG
jgi:phage repressor protein C with HTH and peptisase S24 domain